MIWISLGKKMKKIRPIKNAWYDWLINYISEPKRKSVSGFKDRIVRFCKTNTPKQTVYGREKKITNQQHKIRNKNPFILKKKKKEIKDRIIRDIWILLETEKKKKERN